MLASCIIDNTLFDQLTEAHDAYEGTMRGLVSEGRQDITSPCGLVSQLDARCLGVAASMKNNAVFERRLVDYWTLRCLGIQSQVDTGT